MVGKKREVAALYNVKDHSDITVILNDGEVHVHKCVLVTFCEHFKCMLLGPWADQNLIGEHSDPSPEKKILDVTSYNPRAYRALLKYVYTGVLDPMEGEDLIDLYDISKSYLEDELVALCAEMFWGTIDVDNVALFYEKASDNNCEELMTDLVTFASDCLDEVISSEGFQILESHLAKKLVVDATKRSIEGKSRVNEKYCDYCGASCN